MQSLQLPFAKRSVNVTGMGGQFFASSMGTVDVEVVPHFPSRESIKLSAVVINKLKQLLNTKNLGNKIQISLNWKHYNWQIPNFMLALRST